MDPDAIRELFSVFGPVVVRPMFGGAGVYADGTMFALVHDGVVYLKADAHNGPAFDREHLEAFSYSRRGERASLPSYRRMPDRLYDDPEELAVWARAALAAAINRMARNKKKDIGYSGQGAEEAKVQDNVTAGVTPPCCWQDWRPRGRPR